MRGRSRFASDLFESLSGEIGFGGIGEIVDHLLQFGNRFIDSAGLLQTGDESHAVQGDLGGSFDGLSVMINRIIGRHARIRFPAPVLGDLGKYIMVFSFVRLDLDGLPEELHGGFQFAGEKALFAGGEKCLRQIVGEGSVFGIGAQFFPHLENHFIA